MFLVDAIKGDSENPTLLMKLIYNVFIAIKLRDCASRFSMYHMTPPAVQELQEISHDYFKTVVLFRHSLEYWASSSSSYAVDV